VGQRGERLGEQVAGTVLKVSECRCEVDRYHPDEDLDREAQAVKDCGVTGQKRLLISDRLKPKVDAADLEHSALLTTGEARDTVVNRF
jgi:hypothetical protein